MRVAILTLVLCIVSSVATAESWVRSPRSPVYLAVDVGNVDVAIEWYTQAFGVEVIDDTTAEDGRWRIANLGSDDFAIELIRDQRSVDVEDGVRHRGIRKAGVAVDDVRAVADRVEADMGERPRVVDFEAHAIRILQLKDPEGNTIQLHSSLFDVPDDEQVLLQMHRDVLRYHIEGDVDAWMATESEDYISANRGEISRPGIEERRARLKPYLDGTTFTTYRDLVDPEVRISEDGTLGWVVCQIEMAGSQGDEEIGAVWAWIELYAKENGAWRRIGNVSNRRE